MRQLTGTCHKHQLVTGPLTVFCDKYLCVNLCFKSAFPSIKFRIMSIWWETNYKYRERSSRGVIYSITMAHNLSKWYYNPDITLYNNPFLFLSSSLRLTAGQKRIGSSMKRNRMMTWRLPGLLKMSSTT